MNGETIVQTLPFTTVGHKRILTFPTATATAIKLVVEESKSAATISEIGIYKIADNLIEEK